MSRNEQRRERGCGGESEFIVYIEYKNKNDERKITISQIDVKNERRVATY